MPPVRRLGRPLGGPALLGLLWLGLFLCTPVLAQSLQDYFTNRISYNSASGDLSGNNLTATVEAGEPRHGGKLGGHSVWISWVAPSDGVVRFRTDSSTFDTLLSAYAFTTTNGTTFADLREVARADDSEGLDFGSKVEFGVRAGERYEIAVDGYFGATGQIRLRWVLDDLNFAPPQILSVPGDRAVNFGDSITLSIGVTNISNGQVKWYFNGNNLNISSTNLTLSNFQASNVGRYTLRVSMSGGIQYFSVPIELQINSEGITNALAEAKLLDAPSSPLEGNESGAKPAGATSPHKMGGNASGVVRGYNGTQIFNTTYATVDTNEPAHCGVSGGGTYWLLYQPPANGTVTLDTIGSDFDTAIEAYTYNGALNGYGDLISIQCDNNGANSNGAARVSFAVVKTRQYIVAVEGVTNSRGTAWLNYQMNTNQQPVAPSLLSTPASVAVITGSPASLFPNLAGSPPLMFSWKKNTATLTNITASGLYFSTTVTGDTADYVCTVTNDLGSVTATLPLHVVTPFSLQTATLSGGSLNFSTQSNLTYLVEESANVTGPWQAWPTNFPGTGQPLSVSVSTNSTRFFRVRVQ